ncbi:MAG TPA: hypothetical protein VFV64_09425 [Permianibacter sp.]|nr:hypothetical protein [Permianibacter sp.]
MDGASRLVMFMLLLMLLGLAAQKVANQFRYRLRVMEKKLDLLLSAADLTYDALADIPADVIPLLAKNRYNQAVGHYCKLTGDTPDNADRTLRRYLETPRNVSEHTR